MRCSVPATVVFVLVLTVLLAARLLFAGQFSSDYLPITLAQTDGGDGESDEPPNLVDTQADDDDDDDDDDSFCFFSSMIVFTGLLLTLRYNQRPGQRDSDLAA